MLDSCSSFNEIIACPQAKLWKPFGKMDTESSHVYKTKKSYLCDDCQGLNLPQASVLVPKKAQVDKTTSL